MATPALKFLKGFMRWDRGRYELTTMDPLLWRGDLMTALSAIYSP